MTDERRPGQRSRPGSEPPPRSGFGVQHPDAGDGARQVGAPLIWVLSTDGHPTVVGLFFHSYTYQIQFRKLNPWKWE